jgi:hypothetical protein
VTVGIALEQVIEGAEEGEKKRRKGSKKEELKAVSLLECLDRARAHPTDVELTDACACGGKNMICHYSLVKEPHIFVIQLVRFKRTEEGETVKDSRPVGIFQEVLDLGPYMQPPGTLLSEGERGGLGGV